MTRKQPLFPPWADDAAKLAGALIVGGAVYAVTLIAYATSPVTTTVGYRPDQPVPYSHELHAGQLGMDCRYCHSTVEKAAFAAVPSTQVCMNCHANIRNDSELLAPVRKSFTTGMPLEWIQVHDLPDFVYFDHSAHVNNGVGCATCHGRVDKVGPEGVQQET
jgi:menaquinone reductase, multiheme cytochrome c subunit